jgi:NDP-sugar pyrophosphorylase family protein
MDTVTILPKGIIGKNFIPAEFLPKGENEYYLRNRQKSWPADHWRHLRSDEIEQLVRNNTTSENWDDIMVTAEFNPNFIRDTEFFGLVRIGALRNCVLQHHDLQMHTGITKSRIVSCDIGDDTAIHDVRYMAHYIVGDRCILSNIGEMHATNHAKFGNGIVKEGEPEEVRVWMEIMNESGGRKILPFEGMIPADAYIWAKYRDDASLQEKLIKITQKKFDLRRGFYGTVGEQCVIKNTGILKDVKIGDHCYIKGANKIKNITINSSADEPTQIGEGVELVNGIIGHGSHIFYGCKAVRFVIGNNANLKYGARLINSFLGENSTISCCEVLHNLIFPSHEQHHNNSFLIAALVMGQSNIAAGATIGSNHNSRSNDNEIQAGRGFWPGLCTSVKHSCRFASFVLLSKADYPAELDVPFPFSLVGNNAAQDRIEILPAYWWLFNMYALARNCSKFLSREKRQNKIQNIEFESLAPDTVEEIFAARALLETWTAKAALRSECVSPEGKSAEELGRIGRDLLINDKKRALSLEVFGECIEKSKRKTLIVKAVEAYAAYGDMLHYYAIKNLLDFCAAGGGKFDALCKALRGKRQNGWTNLGGQLVPSRDVNRLRADIGSGRLNTWDKIHGRYDALWKAYPLEKQKHAYATLCELLGVGTLTRQLWLSALDKGVAIQEYVCNQVYLSRKKDDDNPFRQATYRSRAEMIATIGTVEDNSFVKQVKKETAEFNKIVETIKKRG